MKRYIVFLIIFTCCLFSEENPSSLNLSNLIKEVLKKNPDLSATKERINAAKYFQKRVQILEDPSFYVMRHDQPFGSGSNSPFKPKIRYSIFQEIPFPGKLSLKGKIEGQIVEFLKSENIATTQDLVFESKKLFYQLYYYETALKINEFNRNIISEFVQTTFALYKSGKDSFSEAVKAQVDLQWLDDEKLKFVAAKDKILSMINALLNQNAFTTIGTPEVFFTSKKNINHFMLEKKSIQFNPEIRAVKSKISEQNFRKELAKRDYFPNFIVESRFEHILASNDTSWGMTIGITIPLWIPWKQKRDVQKAQSLINAYKDDLTGLKSNINGKIRKLLSEINALDERLFLLDTGILPKTRQSLESGNADYKTGKGKFLTLLDTIRLYYQYELELEQSKIEREISIAELERIVGTKLEEAK